MGRATMLGVSAGDPALSLLSALGLAAAAWSALVVDLVGDVTTVRTLHDLVVEGPRLVELSPGRAGVAVLGRGPEVEDCQEAVRVLAESWPAVVIRCPVGGWPWPVVPVRPLLPGLLAPTGETPAVWQPVGGRSRPPGPGPVLPHLRPGTARRLLSGRLPVHSRWVDAWRRVWSLPWA